MEYIDISKLVPHPDNPRLIKDAKFKKLCRSVKANPDLFEARPILCNPQMVIFAGNMRYRAAMELGLKEVPVTIMDIPEKRQKEIMVVDNVQNGDWDYDKLANMFEVSDLEEWGFDVGDLGMSDVKEDGFDAKKEVDQIIKSATKLGDMWKLGAHRLICGDSTSETDFEKLMAGEKAQLIFTDPPYNVDYESVAGNSYSKGKYGNEGKIFNDNKSDEDALAFYIAVLKLLHQHSLDDASIYWWLAFNVNGLINLIAFKEADWKMSQQITWVKESMVFSFGQDYHRMSEPCFFGWKAGHKHYTNKKIANLKDVFSLDFDSFQDLPDIWYMHRDKTSEYVHPTQKPIRLAGRGIRKNAKAGDVVLDAFGGSGSTLMACEQGGRRARLLELDPKYCDAILKRWADFTKQDPIRENDGLPWSVVSKDQVRG